MIMKLVFSFYAGSAADIPQLEEVFLLDGMIEDNGARKEAF